MKCFLLHCTPRYTHHIEVPRSNVAEWQAGDRRGDPKYDPTLPLTSWVTLCMSLTH